MMGPNRKVESYDYENLLSRWVYSVQDLCEDLSWKNDCEQTFQLLGKAVYSLFLNPGAAPRFFVPNPRDLKETRFDNSYDNLSQFLAFYLDLPDGGYGIHLRDYGIELDGKYSDPETLCSCDLDYKLTAGAESVAVERVAGRENSCWNGTRRCFPVWQVYSVDPYRSATILAAFGYEVPKDLANDALFQANVVTLERILQPVLEHRITKKGQRVAITVAGQTEKLKGTVKEFDDRFEHPVIELDNGVLARIDSRSWSWDGEEFSLIIEKVPNGVKTDLPGYMEIKDLEVVNL